MKIKIKPLELEDEDKLYKFEVENREFFEQTLPSRGENFYIRENFKNGLKALVQEQNQGLVYMYVIIDEFNDIVGRINLVSVKRGKAELEYRIAEKHQEKGIAKVTVKLILEEAKNVHNLNKIEAGTSTKNIASQVVLVKNSFEFTKRVNRVVKVNGKWLDGVCFEKILIS